MDTAMETGICAGDVKAQARDFGADLVGICSCAGFEKALPGCKPEDLVKDARSVVVFARRMPFGNATSRPSVGYLEFGYYGHEAWINKLSYRLALWLEDKGHMALPTPAGRDIPSLRILREGPEPEVFMQGSFDLRLAAVNAGMGEIGVNNNLITAEYGSRLRLGSGHHDGCARSRPAQTIRNSARFLRGVRLQVHQTLSGGRAPRRRRGGPLQMYGDVSPKSLAREGRRRIQETLRLPRTPTRRTNDGFYRQRAAHLRHLHHPVSHGRCEARQGEGDGQATGTDHFHAMR